MSYFWEKIVKISERWGLRPQTPIGLRRLVAVLSDPALLLTLIVIVTTLSLRSKCYNKVKDGKRPAFDFSPIFHFATLHFLFDRAHALASVHRAPSLP